MADELFLVVVVEYKHEAAGVAGAGLRDDLEEEGVELFEFDEELGGIGFGGGGEHVKVFAGEAEPSRGGGVAGRGGRLRLLREGGCDAGDADNARDERHAVGRVCEQDRELRDVIFHGFGSSLLFRRIFLGESLFTFLGYRRLDVRNMR